MKSSKNQLLITIIFLSIGCKQSPSDGFPPLVFETRPAPEWDALFTRSNGWFGGDGIFAIPLEEGNKKKQIILFSDTMLGEIKDSELQEGYHMVNNSVALFAGNKPVEEHIQFPIPKDSLGKDVSVFPVLLPSSTIEEYYWLGDGFSNPLNGKTYIFAYRVVNRFEWVDSLFKFELTSGALIILPEGSIHPYKDQYQVELPFFQNNHNHYTTFGAAVFENTKFAGTRAPDGYLYIYGVRDPGKELLVSRVKPDQFEDFSQWRFYNGDKWTNDFKNCIAISDSVSNELSVSPLPNGQYALIFQISGLVPKVGMRLGNSPIGPFGPIQEIWDCQSVLKEPEFFAYNAKAHPSLSQPGELLISYNVNSFEFWNQIEKYPNLYRPRFFILSWE